MCARLMHMHGAPGAVAERKDARRRSTSVVV